MPELLPCFVACLPGLEPILASELDALGLARRTITAGGVEGRADRTTFQRVLLESGVGTHVLVRIGSFRARAASELRRKIASVDWALWLDPRGVYPVRATSRRSRLYHTGAIERETVQGMQDAGLRGASGKGARDAHDHPIVRVRIEHDEVTVSLDPTGEPLHRRGWRLESGKAPLREDLAHALVLASGWDRTSRLIDPFVGSGTIVIEAARLARRMPPGSGRSFAVRGFLPWNEQEWNNVQRHARERTLERLPFPIVGTDRNDGAIAHARANAERAGVLADLVLERRALRDAPLPSRADASPPCAVVTNPPYGRRLDDPKTLLPLFQTFGTRVRALPMGSRVALMAAERRLVYATGLRYRSLFQTNAGGLAVHAFGCEVNSTAEA